MGHGDSLQLRQPYKGLGLRVGCQQLAKWLRESVLQDWPVPVPYASGGHLRRQEAGLTLFSLLLWESMLSSHALFLLRLSRAAQERRAVRRLVGECGPKGWSSSPQTRVPNPFPMDEGLERVL